MKYCSECKRVIEYGFDHVYTCSEYGTVKKSLHEATCEQIVHNFIYSLIGDWESNEDNIEITEVDDNCFEVDFMFLNKQRHLDLFVRKGDIFVNDDLEACLSKDDRYFWIYTLEGIQS